MSVLEVLHQINIDTFLSNEYIILVLKLYGVNIETTQTNLVKCKQVQIFR